MRVVILALGSRGDVQPYLALAVGLQAAGHRLRIVTLGGFADLARSYAIDHTSILGDPRQLSLSFAGRAWLRNREGPLRYARGFSKVANAVAHEALVDCWAAAQDAEALISSPIGLLVGYHIAEKLDIPVVLALCVPAEPTRYDWNGRLTLGSRFRHLISPPIEAVLRFLAWQGLRPSINAARRDILGLPPLPPVVRFALMNRRLPQLCAYSPVVVARPPDWDELIQVTGYWFLDRPAEWQPTRDLLQFLDCGPPPVYVGFGSTGDVDAIATTRLIAEALALAGQRGLVQAPAGQAPTSPAWAHVHFVHDVPHDWLFPRVSVVVHHGGAGTTAAGLRAGVPSVIVPSFVDQPFWAARIRDLGVGPPPIPRRDLSSKRLAAAIRTATSDPGMQGRAKLLGQRIRAEDGLANAVDAFEAFVGPRRRSP